MRYEPWDKIWFADDDSPYIVKACDERYLVCTTIFERPESFFYTIVDLVEEIRGTENLVFCAGFETVEQCEEALRRLQSGETEISHRNRVPLRIAKTLRGADDN